MIRAGSEMGRAGGSVDASALAKFIVQAADLTLPNAQDLSALANGLLLNTAGVLSKATANTDFMAALAGSGIAKLVAGVPALASAGVDFAKGPWKTFSTVRNGSAAQTLSIPVTDGENNGIVRATCLFLSDGTDRNLTLKINGSATNVHFQNVFGQNVTAFARRDTQVGNTNTYGAIVDLVAFTKSGKNRFMLIRCMSSSTTTPDASYAVGVVFIDTSTVITTIDFDCGNATGLAANTFALVEEGITS